MPRSHDRRRPQPARGQESRRHGPREEAGAPRGADVVYGIHAVRALLARSPQRVRQVYLATSREAAVRVQELRELADRAGVAVTPAEPERLDAMAHGERHQGVVAEIAPHAGDPETQLEEALEALGEVPPLLLVLDGVTDPHNLGACLRCADAAGVAAVIVPRDRAAGLTPVVRKVAAGAAESVPLVAVVNLARTLRDLQARGVWLVGTSDDAPRTLYDVSLTGPTALVMGSEGLGLRRLTREACDELVSLPMAGAVESLNVSVATGIVLFEAVRQRRAQA